MSLPLPLRHFVLAVLSTFAVATSAGAQAAGAVAAETAVAPVTSAPGAEARPGPPAPPGLMHPIPGTAQRRVRLAPPAPAEADAMTQHNRRALGAVRGMRGQPLAIGYPRRVELGVAMHDLAWTTKSDGTRVAQFEIASPTARALRVALTLEGAPAGVTVRVAAKGSPAAVATFGAPEIAQAMRRDAVLWTPVVAGDTAVVEVEVPAGTDLGAATLGVPRLAHLVIAPADLASPAAAVMRASGIGAAAACNVDAACTTGGDPALHTLARSVAKLVFVGELGLSYVCSGTLLNDTAQTNTPYLLTADHCIDSMAAARSIVSFWLFAASSCAGQGTPSFVQLDGGGTLLGRSQDNDWSLVRLDALAPEGTRLAPWRAEALTIGTAVVSLHHPKGDLLKANRGTVTGVLRLEDDLVNADFTEVKWSAGITEGGSSGGALATMSDGAYEVRGALYGGLSTCTRPADPDYFSRLETMLPLVREYLTPASAIPGGVAVAVEFYHALLDRYFLATDPAEIASLDSGRTVGWTRTGLRFLVYSRAVDGASPVCRLYGSPDSGSAHFYSASPAECAQTIAAYPAAWTLETPAAFYAPLPDAASGRCPAGTAPVYRHFNRVTGGHRYTIERVTSQRMLDSPLWIAEGYGPGPLYPVMCAAQP